MPHARLTGLVASIISLALAGTAQAAITRINNVTGSNNGADNTLPATWSSPSSTIAGDLLVAVVAVRGGTGTTITPPAGQSWVLARRSDNGTQISTAIYYIKNAPVQSGTQTWTVSGAAKGTLMLLEYDGVDTTAPLDLTAASIGTGTTADTGTGTPVSDAAELAVGAVSAVDTPTLSGLTTGFTKISSNSSTGNPSSSRNKTEVYEDLFTGAEVPDASVTLNQSEDWAGVLVTFKAANVYWIGSGAGTFSDATRWSLTSGGPNNSPAPTSLDQVVFDSGGLGACTMSANTTIDSVELRSGYTGTVTLAAAKTLNFTHDLTVGAGIFTAGGGAITFNGSGSYKGNINVTGGTVNGGGSAVTLQDVLVSGGTYNTGAGALTIRRNLTMTGGAVSAGGTVGLSTTSGTSTISGGTFTNASTSTSTFNTELDLSGTGGVALTAGTITLGDVVTMTGSSTFTGASGTTSTFTSTLTMTGGTVTTASGAFSFGGNVAISAGTYTSSGTSTSTISSGNTLALSGTGAVSVTGGTFNPVGAVTIAGSSTYTAASGTTNTFGSTLGLTGGTFDLNHGALTLSGTLTVNGGTYKSTSGTSTLAGALTVTSGTFDVAAGTVSVAGEVTVNGGTYDGTNGTSTFTRNTSPSLLVSSGTYDAAGGASTVTNLVSLTGGTYEIGSSATGQTMSAGLTIAGGTLDGSSSTGALKIGAGKTLSMTSGTLQTSTNTTAGPTFSSTTTSTYSFTISGGTVNVSGLAITGVNNSPGVSITGGTLTKLDDVNFANIPATNPGSTSYLLTINVASLSLSTTGDKFDYSTSTFTNLKTIHLTDSGGTVGDVRAYFQCKDSATNGAACGDAADADEDTLPVTGDDGVGDTGNHAVAYWTYGVATDTAGAVQGFPTAAFDWNTFTFYSVYVAFNDVAGAGSNDRIYVRDANGNAVSSVDITNANGNIVGTPYWDTEGTKHVLYVGTSAGEIFKYVDTSGTLALASSPWDSAFAVPATVKSITSPLISDETNIYFAGTNGSSANTLFGVSVSGKAVVKQVASSASVTAAPSWGKSSNITYLFVGSAAAASQAYVYRVNMNPGAVVDASCLQATASIGGSTRLVNSVLYAGDGNAKLHAIDALNFNSGGFVNKSGFPYQDTTRHSPVTLGAIAGAPLIDTTIGRIFFGDADGHLYQLTTAGALVANYPIKVGSSSITTSPVYISNSGVVVVGDSAGNVYYVDQKNASSAPAVFYTETLGGAVSSISWDPTTAQYMVGTSTGQFELLAAKPDPTPTFTF